MKKKILAICLAAIIAVTAIAGASLAYLTDETDTEKNVFTVGSVEIELHESQYHRNIEEKSDAEIIADAKTYHTNYLAQAGENVVPGRWVRKAPYVENTGKNPAYVRVIATMTEDVYNAINIMINSTRIDDDKTILFDSKSDIKIENGIVSLTFTYTEALKPGELTQYAPFWQFQIMPEYDHEDLAKLDVLDVENCINVYAQAIQSEGFDSAVEAFAAFDGQ